MVQCLGERTAVPNKSVLYWWVLLPLSDDSIQFDVGRIGCGQSLRAEFPTAYCTVFENPLDALIYRSPFLWRDSCLYEVCNGAATLWGALQGEG